MQVWNKYAAHGSLKNSWRKNSPSAHHRTTLSGYIFATKACIDNRKKFVKQQYLLHMSSQYGELRPTSSWDRLASLGHPRKFQMSVNAWAWTVCQSVLLSLITDSDQWLCLLLLCQILPDGDLRPQAKHLQSRSEYLLKVLRKQLAGDTKPPVCCVLLYLVDVCRTWCVFDALCWWSRVMWWRAAMNGVMSVDLGLSWWMKWIRSVGDVLDRRQCFEFFSVLVGWLEGRLLEQFRLWYSHICAEKGR